MKNSNIFASIHWHNASSTKHELVVAIAPNDSSSENLHLNIKAKFGVKIAEMAGEPIIQYNDVAHIDDVHSANLQQSLIQDLKQNKIDLLYFRNVRDGSNLHLMVQKIGQIITHKKAPYIDLTKFSDLDGFLKKLSPQTRKSKRRSLKKLNQTYQVDFKTLIDADIDGQIFDDIIELKTQQLKRSGLSSRLFNDPLEIENLKNIILAPHKDFQCIISLLECDGQMAAAEIGYLFNQTYYSFLGAMDENFQAFGPGSCQLLYTLEWAIQNQVKIFDFLAPEDDYKLSWTQGDYAPVYDIIVPLSFKGRLMGQFYLKKLRPWLKKIYLYIKKY